MKYVIIVLMSLSTIQFGQKITPYFDELFLGRISADNETKEITYKLIAVSSIYASEYAHNTNISLSDNYDSCVMVEENETDLGMMRGFDICYSSEGSDGSPDYGWGLYKLICSDSDVHVYFDFRDQNYGWDYTSSLYLGGADIWVLYDDANNNFYYGLHAPNVSSPFSGYIQCNNQIISIWEIKGYENPSQTNFSDFWVNSLAVYRSPAGYPVIRWFPYDKENNEASVSYYNVFRITDSWESVAYHFQPDASKDYYEVTDTELPYSEIDYDDGGQYVVVVRLTDNSTQTTNAFTTYPKWTEHGLKIERDENNHPILIWGEYASDFELPGEIAKYVLFRKYGSGVPWQEIYRVDQGGLYEYTDIDYTINTTSVGGTGILYKVVIVITNNLNCIESNIEGINVSGLDPTKRSEISDETVKEYSIDNYPNPFNPATKIEYSIPEAGFVNLTIYNILGEKITTLINREQNSGKYVADFNASELPSGLYIYTLTTNKQSISKKMMLLK